MTNTNQKIKICIVGMGYVGLPLAVEFGRITRTIGFDINESRIQELISGTDSTLEVSNDELKDARYLSYTSELEEIKKSIEESIAKEDAKVKEAEASGDS